MTAEIVIAGLATFSLVNSAIAYRCLIACKARDATIASLRMQLSVERIKPDAVVTYGEGHFGRPECMFTDCPNGVAGPCEHSCQAPFNPTSSPAKRGDAQ